MTVTQPRVDEVTPVALGGRAARGGVVVLGGQLLRLLVQVVTVAVLARLLTPRDYGLIAMVMTVILVAEILRDMGLSTAALQAKSLTTAQRDNLFWVNTGVGVGLGCVAFIVAPWIGRLYGEPAVVPMTRALAGLFVLNGMATQYRVDLTRRMQFGRLMAVDIAAPIAGLGAAVSLAMHGAEQWALVAQQLAQGGTTLLMLVAIGAWLPGRPRRHVPMTDVLGLGGALVVSQIIGYIANNTDSLLIGTRLGATSLGLYNRAFQVLMNPLNQLRGPLSQVAVSTLAKVPDRERAQRYVERGQVALGFTIVAGLGAVVGGAEPISRLFLGPGWDVAPILSLLAAAGAFQTLALVGYWVYVTQRLTRQLMTYSLVSAGIRVVCIAVGSQAGLLGVAFGYAAGPALAWPVSFWWLSRHAELRVAPLYAGAGRITVLVSITAVGAWIGSSTLGGDAPAVVGTLGAVVGGALAYAAVVALVRPIRRDAVAVLSIARRAVLR